VLAIKITVSHSNGCTSNTPSLPQPNTSSQENYTPISAKFTAVGRELVECTLDVLSVPVVRCCEGGTIKGGNFISAILNFMKVQQIFSRRCPVAEDPPVGCVLHVTIP